VDLSTESLRLLPAAVHEFAAEDALGEAREVLNVGCGGELAAGGDVVGHPAFEEDRLQLSAGGVHGGGVGGGTASDDAEFGLMDLNVTHGGGSVANTDQVSRLR